MARLSDWMGAHGRIGPLDPPLEVENALSIGISSWLEARERRRPIQFGNRSILEYDVPHLPRFRWKNSCSYLQYLEKVAGGRGAVTAYAIGCVQSAAGGVLCLLPADKAVIVYQTEAGAGDALQK